MIELNYKSDFEVVITFKENELIIPVPNFDFRLIFKTDGYTRYIAERLNGELVNCIEEEGKLKVQFKNHGLELGQLRSEYYLFIINANFPDGIQRIVASQMCEITLIQGIGDELRQVNVDWILPTADYASLRNKPCINGVILEGDQTPEDLKIDLNYVKAENIN